MSENKDTFIIRWPFHRWDAILPKASKSDIFVWLYLSLLVHENISAKKENPKAWSPQSRERVRGVLRSKFPQTMNETLLQDIENVIEKEFTEVVNEEYQTRKLNDDVDSFIDSFEYLFSDETEVKTIYKDAVTNAVLPHFVALGSEYHENADYVLRVCTSKEPSNRLVRDALKTAKFIEKAETSPALTDEIIDIVDEFDPDEERWFDDGSSVTALVPSNDQDEERGKAGRVSVKVLEGSYALEYFNVEVYRDEASGEIGVDVPIEVPYNRVTAAWFNMVFKKARAMDKELDRRINEVFPPKKEEPVVDGEILKELFAKKGKLNRCQDLYETVGHSKTLRAELQMEVIGINDNFHAVSGYFHVGRFLDLLGWTIPDTTIRNNVDLLLFKQLMKDACDDLGLSNDDCYKLTRDGIYRQYIDQRKTARSTSFKELIANAIMNNLACQNNPHFYPDIIKDAWYLYGKRSDVDHPNTNARMQEEDIEKLTKVAKFIISIQGGQML